MFDTDTIEEVRAEMAVVFAQHLYRLACTTSPGSPYHKALEGRMSNPRVGDWVLITMARHDDPLRAVGVLEAIEGDGYLGRTWHVRNVHQDPTTITRWGNADCVALPVCRYGMMLNGKDDTAEKAVERMFQSDMWPKMREWATAPKEVT